MPQTLAQKNITYPEIGEVTFFKKSGVKRMSIRISPRTGISVTLPYLVPYAVAERFVVSRRRQILHTLVKFRTKMQDPSRTAVGGCESEEDVERLRKEARKILVPKLEAAARKYGFTYRRVAIKNNVSNWGSCSAKGNINLNMKLVLLPEHLQEFVILHELCHLRYLNHGPEFHALLDSLCGGQEAQLQKELKYITLR